MAREPQKPKKSKYPKKAPVPLNSRWSDRKGKVWTVFQKFPFGRITIKREDRAYFGQISQKELQAEFTSCPENPETLIPA